MILEGNNPLAASLKESSGLMCVNGSGRTLTADVNHNAMTWRFNETGTHVQTMATNESLIPPTCENENEASGNNLHNTNLLASKRNRNDSNNLADDENMEGDFNEIQGEFDLHSNVQKLKQDANYTDKSLVQSSVPQPCCESLENLQERVVGVDGGEGCVVANQSKDAGMEESQFPDDGCSERVGRGGDLNDDQIKDNQTMVDHIPDKMCQDTSGDEAIQNMYVDEVNVNEPRTSTDATLLETQLNDYANKSKGQTESLHEEEMSSDDDEYLYERIDVAKTKSHFFSSQGFLENDFLAASSFTEQNLCMKCNKDGQLLGCNTSSCPLVVHENCLGYPAHFDEMGNFYCPFCAYSLAMSEYLEAKKKASIARKRLASFFQKSLQQHPNESAEELHKKEQTHSRQNGTNEIYDNGHCGGRKHNQVKQNGQKVHDFSDHLCQESISNRNQSEPSASCFKNNLPCIEEMANLASATVSVSYGGTVGKKNIVEERPSVGALVEKQDQAPINCRSDDDNLARTDADVAPVDLREAEGENAKFNISSYSIRVRKQERQ